MICIGYQLVRTSCTRLAVSASERQKQLIPLKWSCCYRAAVAELRLNYMTISMVSVCSDARLQLAARRAHDVRTNSLQIIIWGTLWNLHLLADLSAKRCIFLNLIYGGIPTAGICIHWQIVFQILLQRESDHFLGEILQWE